MAYKERHFRWELELQSPPEKLWSFVSDTNRFNADTGLPPFESGLPDEYGMRDVKARSRFGEIRWRENPFAWVEPYYFEIVRDFENAALTRWHTRATLTPRPDGGTTLVYEVWFVPRTRAGWLFANAYFERASSANIQRAFAEYDRVAQATTNKVALPARGVVFAAGGPQRLYNAQARLHEQGLSPELIDQLVQYIRTADELQLAQIRPYAVADHWQVPRRRVLELCLHATRQGMLEFRWESLCQHCRMSVEKHEHLDGVNAEISCPACRIDTHLTFDQSVELTFRVNPAIRPSEETLYCMGSPQITPHIVLQQTLAPGAEIATMPRLTVGRYRLRSRTTPGERYFQVQAARRENADNATSNEVYIGIDGQGIRGDDLVLTTDTTIRLMNTDRQTHLVMLETLAWNEQAATAADVIALQTFRDLFVSEALRPGEQFSVGNITLLFTDLRRSSQMYLDVGDAVAFGMVMNHFDVLREEINAEEGVLIKTIGDAVMAVFRHPLAAIRAASRAQARFAHPPAGMLPLELKVGIHNGGSIAVTLNNQLDYFGSTVNVAARITNLSRGTDMVISDNVYNDPEVQAWLTRAAWETQPFRTELRGLGTTEFMLWRVGDYLVPGLPAPLDVPVVQYDAISATRALPSGE